MIHPTAKKATNPPEDEQVPLPTPSNGAAPSKSRRRKKAKEQTPPTKDMVPLSPDFQPGKLDVICSRGKFAYNSPGNCWFRTMVEEQMDSYANARSKTDKSLVVSVLVNRVRQANPHGGFVKNFGGQWYRVSDRYSREKVGQQFRDLLHTKYRSSTKAKAEKRRQRQVGDLEHSHSSLDEEAAVVSQTNRERLKSSPRPSPASSAYPMVEPDVSNMPALDFETQSPHIHNLQPKKRNADAGEAPNLEGAMDLAYLDDLEPLSTHHTNFLLADGPGDGFSSVFNPPDFQQSLPSGGLDFIKDPHPTRRDSYKSDKQKDAESDPFFHHYHMSI